jgi:hypothetical protein
MNDQLPASFSDPLEKEIEQKMVKTILAMPKEIQDRFKVLHMLSDKRSKLNDEFNEVCKQIENKILEKKRPLFEKRRQIVAGETVEFGDLISRFDETHKDLEQKVAAIVKQPDQEEEEEPPVTPTDVSYLKGKEGIPDFWFKAVEQNKMIWSQVKEKDREIMKHLRHVESEVSEDPVSKNRIITLKTVFDEAATEFFTPTTL